MANASIGGLVSGLDTATIISQLVQLEARPQTMMKERVSDEQRSVKAMQTLNSKLANITTKASELAKADTWSSYKATSDSENVGVSTSTGAVPATLTLTVVQRATAYSEDYGHVAADAAVTSNGNNTVQLTVDGKTIDLDTGDGTVKGLVDAINSENHGLTATMVKQDDGQYRLRIATTDTGDTAGYTLKDSDGNDLAITGVPTAGKQAEITVDGESITSDSNTFAGLMPGVDVTLKPGATGDATVTVGLDSDGMAGKVKGLVDAVNAALTDLASLTAYDSTTKTAGLLAGDGTMREVRNQLIGTVTGGVGGMSLAKYGIQTDRDGKLVFDSAKFKESYEADPGGTANKFVTAPAGGVAGFAAKVADVGKTFSDSSTGTVTSAIKGRTSAIDRMEDDIADWDVRLEQRRTSLERQYAALEVALGKLQSQSSWLAGQISSLPQMSSGQ